jgi:hypothetical protein
MDDELKRAYARIGGLRSVLSRIRKGTLKLNVEEKPKKEELIIHVGQGELFGTGEGAGVNDGIQPRQDAPPFAFEYKEDYLEPGERSTAKYQEKL